MINAEYKRVVLFMVFGFSYFAADANRIRKGIVSD